MTTKPTSKFSLDHIPHSPGVYLMRDNQANIIYIGKAKDLRKRVSSYFRQELVHPKLMTMMALVQHIDYIPTPTENDSLILEQRLINRIQPLYNVMWKDDKSFPHVELTMHEDYPRLILTRNKTKRKRNSFGPFPNVVIVKKLLRTLWKKKFFPLRPCKYEFNASEIESPGGLKSKRPALYKKVQSCIYLHTGDCPAPCVGNISKENYGKIAEQAGLFFKGKAGPLVLQWKKQMEEFSRNRQYEKAAELRDRLYAIDQISEKISVKEIEEDHIAVKMQTSRALTELKERLKCPTPPIRIEGFDISNIKETEPVASMVVFERGLPLKSDYRMFKIKNVKGQNDFAMIGEVVYRRYRRLLAEGKKFPDLVLIDGGKGQLSSAVKSFKELNQAQSIGKKFQLASLAKQNEEVFLPNSGQSIQLSKESPALHILQAVRDESHRFAVKFHRKRRKKATFT